jgi:hypothetical protein
LVSKVTACVTALAATQLQQSVWFVINMLFGVMAQVLGAKC